MTVQTAEPVDDDSVSNKKPAGLTLTAAAVEKVKALLEQEGRDDLRLRVAVQPGGCAGLRYQLFFDDRLFEGDQVTRFGDVEEHASEPDGPDGGYDSGYESGHDG